MGTNFCGHCGVKFEGKYECRPHEIPRWAYDRYGARPPYGVRLWPEHKPEGKRKWLIQSRSKWRSEEWSKWGYDGQMRLESGYKAVKRWLDMKRAEAEDDVILMVA